MDYKRFVMRTDRIVSLDNRHERLQDTDVSVHGIWRLPDQEGQSPGELGQLVVEAEMLICGEEDGGHLYSSLPHSPPESVLVPEEPVNTNVTEIISHSSHDPLSQSQCIEY